MLRENLALHRRRRVVLLVREREPIKESLVQNVRAHETPVIRTLALRVRRCDNREARCRAHVLADLRNELALALKHRLEAHDEVTAKVNLVKEQHRTALHCDKHGTRHELCLTADESEPTEQLVLIGRCREVDAHTLTLQLRADLLHHRRLAVAAQSRDEHRAEATALDDLLDLRVVAPLHVVAVRARHESLALAIAHRACKCNRALHVWCAHALHCGSRHRCRRNITHHRRRRLARSSRAASGATALHLKNVNVRVIREQFAHREHATRHLAVVADPRRDARHTRCTCSGSERCERDALAAVRVGRGDAALAHHAAQILHVRESGLREGKTILLSGCHSL